MTGLHTGHTWIRGNGEIPLREEDTTVGMALRDAGYRTAVVGKWGLGLPGTAGMPDKKGFDYAFGFLDHRHAHRQFTDHLYRNGEMVATDLEHECLVVCEVKTRSSAGFGSPAEAVDRRKQHRIRQATQLFLATLAMDWVQVRFDVLAVVAEPGRPVTLQHIPGAF